MAENDQEKTEQPTSRKREEARQDGNVPVSKEVSSFFVILGAVLVLYFSGVWIARGLVSFMEKSFESLPTELTFADVVKLSRSVSYNFLFIIAPLFLIPIFGAISYILQNGIVVSGKSLTPDFKKLNPVSGFKKIITINSLAELVKSILKITIISYVAYSAIKKEWTHLPYLMNLETVTVLSYICKVTFTIMTKTMWVLVIISAIDYLYQRWTFEKSLRMTKEEIKEESKQTEGDPMVKARIRSIQRDIARKRMMQQVPEADVVITNPTHLAVALKYDRAKAGAPIVVAKGAGKIAERIRELAREHGVPVLENKPLARSLFKHVDIGREIPANLYKAVAEILAYVYRLKGRAHN